LAPLMDDADAPEDQEGYPLWEFLAAYGYTRPETVGDAGKLLDRAGDDRFAAKRAQFRTYLAEQEAEQTLYQSLMEGLGYRQNQHPFQLLAQRVGYHALRSAALRLPEEERLHAVRCWLTAMSGLSAPGFLTEDAQAKALPRTGFGRRLSADSWRLFRVRPSNHPLRRIGGAAVLIARFLETGLVDGLRQACKPGKPPHLTSALAASGEGRGAALVGQGRARDLAVNVVLPFLHALSESLQEPRPEIRSDAQPDGPYLALYRKFGKLQENEVTREVAEQLLPDGWRETVNSARRQQGLLHLHHLVFDAS
jgi:hypothetical protein